MNWQQRNAVEVNMENERMIHCLEVSLRCLAGYVKEIRVRARRTCSTTIFPLSTNHIIIFNLKLLLPSTYRYSTIVLCQCCFVLISLLQTNKYNQTKRQVAQKIYISITGLQCAGLFNYETISILRFIRNKLFIFTDAYRLNGRLGNES